MIGVDNTYRAEACWSPPTSVDLGSRERGRLAAELLLHRLDNDVQAPVRRSAVQPRLVIRESCGASPQGAAQAGAVTQRKENA